MQKNIKNFAVGTLKVAFAVALIVWLVSGGRIDLAAIRVVMAARFLIPILILTSLNIALAVERWRLLLVKQGLRHERSVVYRLALIGQFFNFAIPGGVGGDLVKAFYLTQNNPHAKLSSALSVLMDRVLGLFSMIFIAVLALALDWHMVEENKRLRYIFVALCLLGGAMFVGFVIALSHKLHKSGRLHSLLRKFPLGRRLEQLYDHIFSYRQNLGVILMAVLLSAVAQAAAIMVIYIVAGAMGAHLPLSAYFVAAPVGFIVTALPISPAGVGVGQAAFLFLFNICSGLESNVGSTGLTVFQIATFTISLLGAWFYISAKKHMPREPQTSSV